MTDKNKKIDEWCSHCDTEVKLKEVFKIQLCPNCGEEIKPCSMCDWNKVDCDECPLEQIVIKAQI